MVPYSISLGQLAGSDGKGTETEEKDEYQDYEKLLKQDEEWQEEHYLPEGWILNDDEHVNLLESWMVIIYYFRRGHGAGCGWMRTKTGVVHVKEGWKEGWVCNKELLEGWMERTDLSMSWVAGSELRGRGEDAAEDPG